MMFFSSKLELAKLNYRVRILIREKQIERQKIVNHHEHVLE